MSWAAMEEGDMEWVRVEVDEGDSVRLRGRAESGGSPFALRADVEATGSAVTIAGGCERGE